MIISFENKELRSICENQEIAIAKLGFENALKLQDRLSDLSAAAKIDELIVGNTRIERIKNQSYFKIDLIENTILTFICGHINPPLDSGGRIIWDKVSRLKLILIEQNNEQQL